MFLSVSAVLAFCDIPVVLAIRKESKKPENNKPTSLIGKAGLGDVPGTGRRANQKKTKHKKKKTHPMEQIGLDLLCFLCFLLFWF